jgi:hypothetical protein
LIAKISPSGALQNPPLPADDTGAMTSKRSWLAVMVVAPLLLSGGASGKSGESFAGGDFASGAISLLVSKRCEMSPRIDTKSIELPALVYGRGRPPIWGRKPAGACRGLDTWVLSESLGAGAYWVQNDRQAIEADPNKTLFDNAKTQAAFKQAFGWELPERGDDVPAHNVFLKFDAKKVSVLFDRIYVKPADKIGDATAQEVYDVLFKGAVARFAREVALIKGVLSKAQLAKQLKAYQAAAKQGGGTFSGPSYLKEAAASVLPKDQEPAARAGRTLGVILRRTADGTWTAINRLLKRVVTDYDPPLAQELGKAL